MNISIFLITFLEEDFFNYYILGKRSFYHGLGRRVYIFYFLTVILDNFYSYFNLGFLT